MTQTLRLNDLQLVLLSTASQRDDGSLLPPPDSIGERTPAVDKAIKSLLRRGLAAEPDTSDISDPSLAERDRLIGVRITAAGRAAIGVGQDEGEEDRSPDEPEDKVPPETEPSSRPVSKIGTVLSLLQREEGATLDEMIAATGWLPHTTRAALTGLRKKGHVIAKDKRGDMTCYRIAAEA
jgi:Protein of unknown function (DUF3489).